MPNNQIKKELIVVHGMGHHDAASVRKEVVDAFAKVFAFYPSLNGKKLEDLVTITPVVYNNVFDDFRQKVAASGGAVAKRLAELDTTLGAKTENVKKIADIEIQLGQDKFFLTHWLDVILYRFTFLAERARLEVAKAVATAVGTIGGANVHVLGHSLGTAVVHDALCKSFGPSNLGDQLNLSPTMHRLGGVHMVANVSRALQDLFKVGESIVRPGPLGCTTVFAEYRHKLDPIPKVRPFDPTDNGEWVPHDVFTTAYRFVDPSSVTAANVHALEHYLLAPPAHLFLMRLLFGFRPTKKEQTDAENAYFATTVLGKAKALQSAFGDLQVGDKESARAVIEAAKALRDLLDTFGETF